MKYIALLATALAVCASLAITERHPDQDTYVLKDGTECGLEGTATSDIAKNQVDMDTHIQVTLGQGAGETEQIIVEVTPRVRKQMKDKGMDWSSHTLTSRLEGKWVEFTGWLLFDIAHLKEAENTQPGGAR